MKKIQIISGILALTSLVFLFCWSYDLYCQDSVEISTGMNALLALILFVCFLSVSISIGKSQKMNSRIIGLAIVSILFAGTSWFISPLLSTMGSIILILIILLIGHSLIAQIDEKSKTGKIVTLFLMGTLLYLSIILIVEVTPLLYTLGWIFLSISSIGVLVAPKSQTKPN